MYTRLLEHYGCQHVGIEEIKLRERRGRSLVFDASCILRIKQGGSSGSDMFDEKLKEFSMSPKTLQVDIEDLNTIRVRFSEGREVPENSTPMVTGSYKGIEYGLADLEDRYEITTARYKVVLSRKPYSLRILDHSGKEKFGASCGELNGFEPMDAFSLGLSKGKCNAANTFFPSAPQFDYERNIPEVTLSTESFSLKADEYIYGFGENFTGLDKKFQTIDLWTQDALGPVSPRTYKPIPFFVSSKGYGVFVNSSAPMTFWVGSMSNIRNVLSVEADFMDYYVLLGDSMKEVLGAYNDLTGHYTLPPKWSFGFWLSKFTYHSDPETTGVVREMRSRKLPFDVLHLDTHWFEEDWICDLEFGKTNFPDPESYIRRMKENGVHISLWQMPYIDSRSSIFEEARDRGFFPKKDGQPVLYTRDRDVSFGVLDITNPEALAWWKEKFRKLFRLGAAVIKTDFGEGAPTDCVYYDGTPGRIMHNLYPLLYNKAVYEVTSEFAESPFVWARSAWAGCQRYPLHWGGDVSGYFEQLVPQLAGGLSFMMSGFSFWSQDIGGFANAVGDSELYIRWYQLGLFMTHPRLHGVGEREPYRFGKDVEDSVRELLSLRYRLLPYIYSSAYESVRTKVPFLRPLALEFEGDRNLMTIDDEFMFGSGILVAPFTEKGGKRSVYLPDGNWYDFWTGEKFSGGQWMKVAMDIDRMPLYVREGAIIPMGPVMQYVGEVACDPITLLLYPAGESSFDYYDDGEAFCMKLTDNSLSIGSSTHNYHVIVFTDGVVKDVLVNDIITGFQIKEGRFEFDCSSGGIPLDIEWR